MVVPNGLLVMLESGPKHGYQLKMEFEASTGHVWTLNIGQVYTTLGRLVRGGLAERIECGEDEARAPYRITEAGRQAVHTWFSTPVDRGTPKRNELTAKLMLALHSGQDFYEVLQVQRAAAVGALQQYTRLKAGADGEGDFAWLISLDALILQTEAEVRWLDLVERRVEQLPPGPLDAASAVGAVAQVDLQPVRASVGTLR